MIPVPARSFTFWLVVTAGSTVAAILASATAAGTALTTVPVLWFLAVIPGMPYARMLGFDDPLLRWITAVGLSVALAAVVAEAMLLTGSYTGFRTIVVLAVVACTGAVIGRLRVRRDPEPSDPPTAPIQARG